MNPALSTRRQFLAAGVALRFALRAIAQGNAVPRWIFLGTDKGKGIYRAHWDATTGTLGAVELAAETDRPDFFVLHPKLPMLYTVNSLAGDKAGVSGYRIDKEHGSLSLLNRLSSYVPAKPGSSRADGDGPCFVSVDRTGSVAYVANYTGGSLTSYALEDGVLHYWDDFQCSRNRPDCGSLGPVKERQDAAHFHCATFSPDNYHVLVCDLGNDAIQVFRWYTEPPLSIGHMARIPARSGSGPRHLAFHPNGKWLYCIHELDCTVDLYDWKLLEHDPYVAMTLREDSVVSTLNKGTPLTGNTACEIFLSDDGRFVYTCTRGVDEIVVYRVDPSSGLLTEHQRVSSGGKIPRYITLDPSGKWLVCCNQGAAVPNPVGNVTVFAHDLVTGRLSEKPNVFAAETPMFAAFV